jgi:hypothetical protein
VGPLADFWFNTFEEGTVMALTAYGGGGHTLRNSGTWCTCRRVGNFRSIGTIYATIAMGRCGHSPESSSRPYGPPRDRDEPISDRHRDLAHALQTTIEETVVHVVRGCPQLTAPATCVSRAAWPSTVWPTPAASATPITNVFGYRRARQIPARRWAARCGITTRRSLMPVKRC